MDLDRWQKLTDISIKGIATVAIAGLTLWYTAQRFDTDKSKLCTDSLDQTFKMVVQNEFSEQFKVMLDSRISAHEKVCGKLEDRMINMLNNAWKAPTSVAAIEVGDKPVKSFPPAVVPAPQPSVAPGVTPATRGGPQWVALSRRNDTSYSAVNFDLRKGDAERPWAPGNILEARWFVNIRAKNTPVARGDNPIVGQLIGGECVRVIDHVTGTLNEWAKVEQSACP